jgi:LacI family transcriptional regulator
MLQMIALLVHDRSQASVLMSFHQNSAGRGAETLGRTAGKSSVLERRPRVADVAARAGVSTATVDRVINGRGGVHQKTVARVEEAIREIVRGDHRIAPRSGARFDIFLPADSGRSTEVLAEALTTACAAQGVDADIVPIERINPTVLAERLLGCAARGSAGVAFQGVDHPIVRDAMQELTRANIPIVTLCSDVTGVERLAYVGVDNRAAGRTSGMLMGRFCRGPGKLAVVWGGSLYRSHEEREIGFRAVLRHEHPDLQILEMVNGNDDADMNFARLSEVIAKHPDLLGVYCVGGGQKGVAAALEQAGVAASVVMIGHNFNEETKPFLLSGTIDAVIHQDMTRIAGMAMDCLLGAKRLPPQAGIPVEIITRENLVYR